MRCSLVKRMRLGGLLAGAGVIALAGSPAQAQILHRAGQACPPAPCPAPPYPYPVVPPAAPPGAEPVRPPTEPTPPTAPQAPTVDLSAVAPESLLPGGGETTSFAPNMIGDLLMGNRSVFFDYQSAITGAGATSIVNPKVSENNSPQPRDRVSFRYNHFNDALQITGASNHVGTDPTTGATGFLGATKDYDDNAYTFSVEKTFFDQLMSVELRAPFSTTLSSHLNLSTGTVTNRRPLQGFFTLQNTLGQQDTEFNDMSLIFKAVFFRRPRLLFSGGLSLGIPTGEDVNVRVTDFVPPINAPTAFLLERDREFHVDNSTWSLSPYIAMLATPSDRFFLQGFLQVDVPLNSSKATFTETTIPTVQEAFPTTAGLTTLLNQLGVTGFRLPPFTESARIDEQTLLHVDLGTGFWLARNPEAKWIKGIAPTLELHYTTTLDNADIVTFSRDGFLKPQLTVAQLTTATQAVVNNPRATRADIVSVLNKFFERSPTVGNLRNRVDILDLTVGTTFEVGDRATLAAGFAFPLLQNDNRTFDWEFQVQLNYYFGAGGLRRTPTVLQ